MTSSKSEWPEDWQENAFSAELAAGWVGIQVAAAANWINRRVEQITFVDERSVQRRVSLDLTFPHQSGELENTFGDSVFLIPLTTLRKRTLRRLDLKDESGTSLPVLTKRQNSVVAQSALERAATAILEDEPPEQVLLDLANIVHSEIGEAREIVVRWEASKEEAHQKLLSNSLFNGLFRELSSSFILLTTLRITPGARRILKFSYEETLPKGSRPVLERLAEKLGWQPTVMEFALPAIGDCSSFHFESMSPPGLKIVGAQLYASLPAPGVIAESNEEAGRVHLNIQDAVRGSVGRAWVSLSTKTAGLLRGAIVVSSLIAAVVTVGSHNLKELDSAAASSASLLIAVPGIFATFLVRQGEHGLASRLLIGIRAAALVAGVLSYFAAASLVLDIGYKDLVMSWQILTNLSWIVTITLVLAWILPKIVTGRS